jgi:peptide/nickel transport system substrate-binding protein
VSTWTGGTQAEQIDDWTFRLLYDNPQPRAVQQLASQGAWNLLPKHYLQKWHIDFNPDAEKVAKEEGFDLWNDALYSHYWWAPLKDIEKPVFQPWIITQADSAVKVFERNPYYARVDTKGQQLPYIDRIVSQIVDQEVYNLKIITGEADVAYMNTTFDNFTLYKESEDAEGYTVYELPGLDPVDVAVIFHMLCPDPIKLELFEDVRFRRALSVAVNRDEINELVYFGKGVPRQASSRPGPSWYKPEWAEAYAQYDPALANRLLDEVGLTNKDSEGFRLGKNGKRITLLLQSSFNPGQLKTMELINEFWAKVGIDSVVKNVDGSFAREYVNDEKHDFQIRPISSDGNFAVTMWARSWEFWMRADDRVKDGRSTMEDYPDGFPGFEPPDWVKEIHNWFVDRNNLRPDSKEYADISTAINQWQADNLFTLGFVGLVPYLLVAKDYVGNIPTEFSPVASWWGDLSRHCDQVYLEGK